MTSQKIRKRAINAILDRAKDHATDLQSIVIYGEIKGGNQFLSAFPGDASTIEAHMIRALEMARQDKKTSDTENSAPRGEPTMTLNLEPNVPPDAVAAFQNLEKAVNDLGVVLTENSPDVAVSEQNTRSEEAGAAAPKRIGNIYRHAQVEHNGIRVVLSVALRENFQGFGDYGSKSAEVQLSPPEARELARALNATADALK